MKINRQKPNRKKALFAVITLLVLLAAGYLVYAYSSDSWPFVKEPGSTQRERTINHERSDAEIEREEEVKSDPTKKLTNQTDTPDRPAVDPSTNKQSVTVIITSTGVFDGQADARGFVSNSVESSGTCTYIFTKGGKTVTKTSSVLPNPSSTTCETVRFPVSELDAGKWEVRLEFGSDASYGKSEPKELTV